MNFCQSPRWGSTWSTTVALVRCLGSPGGYCAAHLQQNGSRRSCAGRRSSFQIGKLYQSCHLADTLRPALTGLCFSQYPSRVRAEHPGCRQGLSGFKAMAITSWQNKKRPSQRHPKFGFCHGSGAGHSGRGLRRFDIHNTFLPTSLALYRQVPDAGSRQQLQQLAFSTDWADHPSVLCVQFTMSRFRFQALSLTFSSSRKLFNYISRIRYTRFFLLDVPCEFI